MAALFLSQCQIKDHSCFPAGLVHSFFICLEAVLFSQKQKHRYWFLIQSFRVHMPSRQALGSKNRWQIEASDLRDSSVTHDQDCVTNLNHSLTLNASEISSLSFLSPLDHSNLLIFCLPSCQQLRDRVPPRKSLGKSKQAKIEMSLLPREIWLRE